MGGKMMGFGGRQPPAQQQNNQGWNNPQQQQQQQQQQAAAQQKKLEIQKQIDQLQEKVKYHEKELNNCNNQIEILQKQL